MSSDPNAAAGNSPGAKPHPAKPPAEQVPFTRAAALWGALITGFLILIVLLVFVAENTVLVELQFLSLRWSLPLGVAILLAAVGGGLLTVMIGTVRIYQLRRAVKKNLAAKR